MPSLAYKMKVDRYEKQIMTTSVDIRILLNIYIREN